jgi:NDP-sugar pyrophosphorylase family protein
MALIAGVPFLQVLLSKIHSEGISEVVLGTGYMAEQVENYFGRGDNLSMRIIYSREAEPLGTGGALKLAESQLSDPVLVLNGDSFAEWSLAPMLQILVSKAAEAVLVLQRVTDTSRYGSVTIADDDRVLGFAEKRAEAGPGLINAGVYLLRNQIVRDLPAGKAISLEKDVFPRLLDRKIYGLVSTGPFVDIGIPDGLSRAQTLLAPLARAASAWC